MVFRGLDTYADVTLNGKPLLSADNMFRTWRADAKPLLVAGENVLLIRFRSPINEILPKMKGMKYELPATNDQGEKTSPHTRKAPYQYGWDWGPRFVTSGVWRPVMLDAWDGARVDSVSVVKQDVASARATLTAAVQIWADAAGEAAVTVDSPSGEFKPATVKAALAAGDNRVEVPVVIENPKLWWPNGLGAQPLYTLRARAAGASGEATSRAGVRTVEVRREKDEWGKSFAFYVNGSPVFMKGANWIPADSFPNRVTPARYRDLIESYRDSNFNMIRVWGGGYYEEEAFYDACDELGILVWQDFMFGCSMYPGDEKFLESVRHEAVDNVRRLRGRASLALWCGNNEVETAWHHWGWKQQLPASLWDDYLKLFRGVLPEVVAAEDPQHFYWSSSPSSDLEEDAESQTNGDLHYWAVWHASKPFEEYRLQAPRFMSEYGFQSFPILETVKTYTTPADYDIESPVMKAHQRHPRGNTLVREYMLREYREPKDFESFLYVSQVLQADGIRTGTEHMRRIKPRNMGALYWQANDCWPVASWSSIDYFGRWKALQYASKRFFRDVLVSAVDEKGRVAVWGTSDRLTPVDGTLEVRVRDFTGKTLASRSVPAKLAANESRALLDVTRDELLKGADPKACFLEARLVAGGATAGESVSFFGPYKDLLMPKAKVTAEVKGGGAVTVTVTADAFARAVYLEAPGVAGRFSDNFFDVVPGEPVTVTLLKAPGATAAKVKAALRVRSMADAF